MATHGANVHEEHGHGHDDRVIEQSRSKNMQYKIPTKADLDYQLPHKAMFNEKLMQWFASHWPVDRDDLLNNDVPNKFSAYYWFSKLPL